MRFEIKLDNEIIGYSDLEHPSDRSTGGASGRFVPAPAYAAVRQYFAEHTINWVPMPNLTLWLAGGGSVECVGGLQVMDSSVALGKDMIEVDVAGITYPSYDELFPDWAEVESRHQKKHIEALLAKAIQSYLPVHGRGDEAEQEQRQQVCFALDALLALLLRETETWSPYDWNDGVLASIEIPSPGLLDLQGLATWAKDEKRSGFYWEPFAASVRVSEAGNELLGYEIKFADAALGLGKVPYNTHPRGWNCAPPKKWMFTFGT